MIWNNPILQTNQRFQKHVTTNVYKTCPTLDFPTILDANNLLAYGETLSEQVEKVILRRKRSAASPQRYLGGLDNIFRGLEVFPE